ncbi:hypothetical protein A2U01_0051431, partial [Trifolium medium]|nr:hypothetical protein [Trifolium medium]
MGTVSEGDWLSYLAKSKQKKLEPEATVSPDVQLILGEPDGAKGTKMRKRGEVVRPSKVPKKDGGSSSQVVDLEAGESQPSSPQPKGNRALWSRTTSADLVVQVIRTVEGKGIGLTIDP